MKAIRRSFGKLKPGKTRSGGGAKPKAAGRAVWRTKDVEQVHFCFGAQAPPRGAEDRFDFGMMNLILGGGMSSRLFKEVREKRGLVYSIQSFAQPFRGAGCFGVSGSASPDNLAEVVEIGLREIGSLAEKGPSEAEMELAREQIVDSVLMSLESTGSRMSRLADGVMTFGRPVSPDEVIAKIRGVTAAGVRKAARKYLASGPLAGAFIGPGKAPKAALKPLEAWGRR